MSSPSPILGFVVVTCSAWQMHACKQAPVTSMALLISRFPADNDHVGLHNTSRENSFAYRHVR